MSVACTAPLWYGYIVPHEPLPRIGEAESDRAMNVLGALRAALVESVRNGHRRISRIAFPCSFLMDLMQLQTVQLQAICRAGDHGEPIVTVMFLGGEWQDPSDIRE
jgi:hypothetical protein